MPDNVVATFVSALVGGEVRGRVVICATVILEGLNVSKANLQLESMCATCGSATHGSTRCRAELGSAGAVPSWGLPCRVRGHTWVHQVPSSSLGYYLRQ